MIFIVVEIGEGGRGSGGLRGEDGCDAKGAHPL